MKNLEIAKIFERTADVPHQRLAIRTEPNGAAIAVEEFDTEGSIQLANGVADSTGTDVQLFGCRSERAGAAGCFESAEDRQRRLLQHAIDEPDSPIEVKKAFVLQNWSSETALNGR